MKVKSTPSVRPKTWSLTKTISTSLIMRTTQTATTTTTPTTTSTSTRTKQL